MEALIAMRNTMNFSNQSIKYMHDNINKYFLKKNTSSTNLSPSWIKIPLFQPLQMSNFIQFIFLIQMIYLTKFLTCSTTTKAEFHPRTCPILHLIQIVKIFFHLFLLLFSLKQNFIYSYHVTNKICLILIFYLNDLSFDFKDFSVNVFSTTLNLRVLSAS